MTNPYVVDDQEPRTKPSVFAFLDILGYRAMVVAAAKDGTSDELLSRLHDALTRGRVLLDPDNPYIQDDDPDLYVLKAFTDSIVIGWPADDDAEGELGSMYGRLADFQLEMASSGFFVRGGLSVGMAYVDDITTFGEALLDAYTGESELARDPRIVLTTSATALMARHVSYYAAPEESPQNSELLLDSDAQVFINYLNSVLVDGGLGFERLVDHRNQVIAKLEEFTERPSIWSKYAWAARYHNAFCEQNMLEDAYRIPVETYAAEPRLLIEPDV